MRDWKAILDYVCEQYVQRNFNEGNTEWMPERWRNQKDVDVLKRKLKNEFGVDLGEEDSPHSVEQTMERMPDEYATQEEVIRHYIGESFIEEMHECMGEEDGLTDLYSGEAVGQSHGFDKEQDKAIHKEQCGVIDFLLGAVIQVIQLQDLKEE